MLDTPWLQVHEDSYRRPDGRELTRFLSLDEPDGVNVVVVTPAQTLLLVRQFRPALGRTVFDFPAGLVEAGEDPLDCARRELLEETGYASDSWIATGSIEPAPHRLRKTEHCFLAVGAEPVAEPAQDENEELELLARPVDDVDRMIREGEFTCAVCIASLALARLHAPEHLRT